MTIRYVDAYATPLRPSLCTPVSYRGDVDMAEIMMEYAAEKVLEQFMSEKDGMTPLHRAARNNVQGNADVINLLTSKGANVNHKASDDSGRPGGTALHLAASLGNFEIVKQLLTNGADPNAKDISGNTPLHAAVERPNTVDHPKVVDLLRESGADNRIKNLAGNTPYDVGKAAKTDNVLMKDTVIPKLKVMTAREIEEEERLMEKLKDNHKKVIGKLYSSKSGVKYNDDLTPDMLHRKSTADKKTKKKKDSRD